MTIRRINTNLDTSEKIKQLNDMILELSGKIEQGKFDKNEIDALYTDLGSGYVRKFYRNTSLGNTEVTYTGWSHIKAETGYSIWKYAPTNYAYSSLNQLYFNGSLLDNMGEADSETATSFDSVFLYNGATSGYTNNTTESATETGTSFELMDASNDYLYVGLSTTFEGIKLEFETHGSGYTNLLEYYNGSAWVPLTSSADNLVDETSDFESDGLIYWDIPGDWNVVSINSVTKYWIRIYTSSTPVTTAEAYYIIPGNSVIGLLALSSEDIILGNWAWCTYSGSVYVTIRNSGATSSEGDFFITSTSSTNNKQNYFIYNNEYSIDYLSSLY
jgi:hypothetical protein